MVLLLGILASGGGGTPLAGQAAPPDPVAAPEAERVHPGEPLPFQAPDASPWFPGTRLFRGPRAAPGEPAFRGAAISTDLFRGGAGNGERELPRVSGLRDGGRDYQGVVSLGESYPVRRFGRGSDGVQLGVQVRVTARFRLATSSNEYVASDWVIGLPVEFARGPVAGRAVLFHRSAHLGDEIMERAGVGRIGFGHEGVAPPGERRRGASPCLRRGYASPPVRDFPHPSRAGPEVGRWVGGAGGGGSGEGDSLARERAGWIRGPGRSECRADQLAAAVGSRGRGRVPRTPAIRAGGPPLVPRPFHAR